MKEKIILSSSGGATSAKMTKDYIDENKLKPVGVFGNSGKPKYYKHVNDNIEAIAVFCNTTREDDRTLDFVNNLDLHFKIHHVWLEAFVLHGERKSTTYKITNYKNAKRDGSIFEEVIKKYGIPNTKFLHCTRELKMNPIKSFMKDIGFENAFTAIGYRYDEPKRVNLVKAKEKKQFYPLWEKRQTKKDVSVFWDKQTFKLGLLEFEGNCRLCYKKSKRKLLSQIITDGNSVHWIKKMEKIYSNGGEHLFFRDNESINDLIEQSKEEFKMWQPNENKQIEFNFELDQQESCEESCEPFE